MKCGFKKHLLPAEIPTHRNYFEDGERRIDFVLVCYREVFRTERQFRYIQSFISNLEAKGLHFELSYGIAFQELIFIKLHGPKNILELYAAAFDVTLAMDAENYHLEFTPPFDLMATEITKPNPASTVYARAIRSLSNKRPSNITCTERIMILNKLLLRTPFGEKPLQYGLPQLLRNGIFIAAYPLHVGPYMWSAEGSLNDRQLLRRYWARPSVWYKQQPLDLIQRYFGTEVALYFAFCGFYNKMLMLASGVGFLCFLYGVTSIMIFNSNLVKELCGSDYNLCPLFLTHTAKRFTLLREFCSYAKMTYAFDNGATVFFALFMSVWASIFMEMWKRNYAVLLLRWNFSDDMNTEEQYRKEYGENTHFKRICPITGTLQPYVPTRIKMFHLSLTCVTCMFLASIILVAVLGTVVVRIALKTALSASDSKALRNHGTFISMACSSYLCVIFINIFSKFYGKIAMWLTTVENPRTQAEFDNSYIFKRFLISFVNNYSALSYIVFIKGRLYTYPGDKERFLFKGLKSDVCGPTGCLMALCIQLTFIMLFKSMTGNIISIFKPLLKIVIRKRILPITLPQWELDFGLEQLDKYFLIKEYSEMVIQYGLVTFFSAAFPLAPLCALINNLIELRTDAYKFVNYNRRPIPISMPSMKAWNDILQAMTIISMVTNAFVVAFGTDFVKQNIYKYSVDPSLKGYINSTLSVFDMKDFKGKTHLTGKCYYRSSRYPPDSPQKYQLRPDYWYELLVRFIVAVIFEHIILIITGLLSYAIPDIPYKVETLVKYKHQTNKEQRIKQLQNVQRGTNMFAGFSMQE